MTRRLLIVSDSPAIQSGLGRVVRELASRFHRNGVQVVVAGAFHHLATQAFACPYYVLPAAKGVSPDAILDTVRPDTVLAIGDPWDFGALAARRATIGQFRLVGYLNIEAGPMPPQMEPVLDAFDVLTTTSEYGAGVLARAGVTPIHHGVDRDVFKPVPPQKDLAGIDLASRFVVLLNSQNVQRKNLPTALAGFGLFARDKDDVLCFANTQVTPADHDAPGYSLGDVVAQLGLTGRVVFNPNNGGPTETVSDDNVNAMYAMATALLVTSHAEGFGLHVLEALATKTVPIAPAGFSMPELLAGGRGELIPIAASIPSVHGTDYAVVSAEAVATSLEVVYQAWKRGDLDRYHRPGMAFALSRTWDRTYRLLTDAMEVPPASRVADGRTVDPYLRLRARRSGGRVGLVKIGGLGEQLQATVVVDAAARRLGEKVTVLTNAYPELFESMPAVEQVIRLKASPDPQEIVARSVADQYRAFFDVRVVSRAYGLPTPEFFTRHAWFFDAWPDSCGRLSDLGLHGTQIMLESLGLDAPSIRPIVDLREGGPALANIPYVAVASGSPALGPLSYWPAERWDMLVADLEQEGFVVVQVGLEHDPAIGGTMDFRGESIARQAAVLEGASLFIGVDGPMPHLAAGVGVQSIVLYGPTPAILSAYPATWPLQVLYGEGRLGPAGPLALLLPSICPPCWGQLPGWIDQVCPRGVASCVNWPSSDRVIAVMRSLAADTRQRVMA